MVAAVCIIGRKNAGKTTTIERLLPALIARGRRVATIKHDAHDFEIDVPGKDSWRHRQAGSCTTIVASSSKVAMVRFTDREAELDELLRLVDGFCDLVLIEGLGRTSLPKILVRPELDESYQVRGELLAIVTDSASASSFPCRRFRQTEMEALAELMDERFPRVHRPASSRELSALLDEASRLHGHLCPGQVLGVRMAIKGCESLGIGDPRSSKRLVTFLEIDRCAADAIQSVTGCTVGKRTLKLVDYGKLAATFLDLETGRAVRISVRESAREAATRLFPPASANQSAAQLEAYTVMSDDELFTLQEVRVTLAETERPGPPLRRTVCDQCGEGVNDAREVLVQGRTLCRACAQGPYYSVVQPPEHAPLQL